jgi:hypothetical protein
MAPDEESTGATERREVNMIGILRKTAPLGALLAVLGAGSAHGAYVEAKVPFDFIVHGKTLPAGDYILEHDDNQPSVLFIRSKDGMRAEAIVLTEPAGDRDPAGDTPALRFTHRGTQYYLADVWRSRDDGWEIEGKVKK